MVLLFLMCYDCIKMTLHPCDSSCMCVRMWRECKLYLWRLSMLCYERHTARASRTEAEMSRQSALGVCQGGRCVMDQTVAKQGTEPAFWPGDEATQARTLALASIILSPSRSSSPPSVQAVVYHTFTF